MIIYRPATMADVPEISRVTHTAFNALNAARGFPLNPSRPPSPFYGFAITEPNASCWVAESDGTIIGNSISHKSEGFWFLTNLFVDPASQEQGVGRALLGRTLAHGGGDDATIRALITLAFNPVSTSLYIRHGMYPLDPIYTLDGSAKDLRGALVDQELLPSKIVQTGDETVSGLAAVDLQVLGYRRPLAHRYCLSQQTNTCHVFHNEHEILGYAYISATGRIGPAAAVEPLSLMRIISTAINRAVENGAEQISMTLAGSSQTVLAAVIDGGMRIRWPQVLMASGRFGDLSRYAFHPPGSL
jgi:ribosomal protein S18 acetylase RimI-like enzyme